MVAALAASAGAQTAKDAEKTLRESLVKKQMFLRGYSADNTVKWTWDGKALVAADPAYLALSALTVKTVKLNGDHLIVQGDRQILVRTEGRNAQFSGETVPVTIDADLHGGNAVEVLPTLAATVFYSDMNGAIRDLPTTVIGLIPTPPAPKPGAAPASTDCDCSHPSACSEYIGYTEMKGAKAPSVKADVPPPVSDQPYVTLVGIISDAGKLDKIWLGRPLNPTFDQALLNTAKGYTFTPATCHDKPVSAALRVDVPAPAAAPGGRGKR